MHLSVSKISHETVKILINNVGCTSTFHYLNKHITGFNLTETELNLDVVVAENTL